MNLEKKIWGVGEQIRLFKIWGSAENFPINLRVILKEDERLSVKRDLVLQKY